MDDLPGLTMELAPLTAAPPPPPVWGRLVRVVDGDTAEFEVREEFRSRIDPTAAVTLARTLSVRITGMNAPELTGPTRADGLAAKRDLESLLAATGGTSGRHTLTRHRAARDKYGRWLFAVEGIDPATGAPLDIAAEMIRRQRAVVMAQAAADLDAEFP